MVFYLEIILDYIRADNPGAAERFGTALLDHVEILENFRGSASRYRDIPASGKSSIPQSESITGCTKIRR